MQLNFRVVAAALIAAVLVMPIGSGMAESQPSGLTAAGDPRLYGAKCDGQNDDTAAIQAVIDSGYNHILIPPGQCVISPQNTKEVFHLPTTESILIQGEGVGVSILRIKPMAGDYSVIFGPQWAAWPSFTLTDLTIDQNSALNPVTSNISIYPRQIIATGGGNNLLIDRIEVANVNSRQAIMSTSRNTSIVNSRFVSNGGGKIYHDSSTLYLAADNSIVTGNIFESSGVNAAGAVTAIETHGGGQTISGNIIEGYENGMNVTGVEALDTRSINIAGNVIRRAYYGIDIWSNKYKEHRSGYGIDGIVVANNIIALEPAEWKTNATTGGPMAGDAAGIFINASSDLPLRGVVITGNRVEFAAQDEKTPTDFNCMGIGYRDASERNTIDGWTVTDNVIDNAPAMGIYIATGGANFDISHNTIINAGSSQYSGLYHAFKSGIFIGNKTVVKGLIRLANNYIVDSRDVALMSHGIYITSRAKADIVVTGQVVAVTGHNSRQFLGPIAVIDSVSVPHIEVIQMRPTVSLPDLPTGRVALGSTITDGLSGLSWVASVAGTSWQRR